MRGRLLSFSIPARCLLLGAFIYLLISCASAPETVSSQSQVAQVAAIDAYMAQVKANLLSQPYGEHDPTLQAKIVASARLKFPKVASAVLRGEAEKIIK